MNPRAPVVSGNPKGPQEKLYIQNIGLIGAALARGFSLAPAQQDTAESCAKIGLWHACRNFDPKRGVKFSTYATHCIRRSVQRGLLRGRDAEAVPCAELDAPLGDEDGFTLLDTLADSPHARPGAALLADAGFESLASALAEPRLQAVVRRAFGEGETLQAIAEEWGVSRERVRQLQTRALTQIRQNIIRQNARLDG